MSVVFHRSMSILILVGGAAAFATLLLMAPEEKRRSRLARKSQSDKSTVSNEVIPPSDGRLVENMKLSKIRLHDIISLRTFFPSEGYPNKVSESSDTLTDENEFVLGDIVRTSHTDDETYAYVRGGPRGVIHFDPLKVRAAIVTCGGLCPGLNNVIRELVRTLLISYKAESVLGIRGGFTGFLELPGYDSIELNLKNVDDIQHDGGTILASSRGGFDLDVIIEFLQKKNISQLYVIGGDGTHRGAYAISQELIKRKLNISVAGIPKTIDNDVDLIDRSFGFTTSVEAAQAAIVSAKTEARCNLPNGIGIVKLMGRFSGFIAAHATLASGDVDLCLVPEMLIDLNGENGILKFLKNRVARQGHAVIVVAEGAGEELLGKSLILDASGNRKPPAVGEYLKKKIEEYFASDGLEATVKYVDPSYMIRSVPANASDALYCMLLSQSAVHGAMVGYTGFSVGLINNRMVYIPIPLLVATSPRILGQTGRTWERVRAVTLQPPSIPSH